MRLVTYNIRKGLGADGRAGYQVDDLARALSQQELDLVLCQEVFHAAREDNFQTERLATHLNMNGYYRPNKKRRVGHHGNATFTRWDASCVENFDLSQNRVERRGALYTRFPWGSKVLHVVNVHLSLSNSQRVAQLAKIRHVLRQVSRPDDPILLAGDFNDWRGNLDAMIQKELGLRNALEELSRRDRATWHAKRPIFGLDRVYVRNLNVGRAERLGGEVWSELSDHLPLLVEVRALF